MSKARTYESLRAKSQPADDLDNDTEYDEDVSDDSGYYDDDYYDAEAAPLGLFGTPGRAITLVGSVLILILIVGTLAWLLGSQTGNRNTNVGASSSTNINTSGLQTAVKVGALAPDFTLNEMNTGKPISLSSL